MKKLRWTFIGIASAAVLLVLTLVLTSLYAVNVISTYNEIYSITEFIIQNSGKMPHIDMRKETVTDFSVYEEMQYETRYFSLLTDSDGDVLSGNFDHIASVNDKDADELLRSIAGATARPTLVKIFSDPRRRGIIYGDDGDYAYMRRELSPEELVVKLKSENFYKGVSGDADELSEDGGYIIVFLDCSRRILDMRSLRVSMLVIGISSFLIFFIIISAYSKRAIQPYIDNHEKQRQFITNAGHELKTPLTIISANMEVLEMINGGNEWTESTLNQVKRLTGLVTDLITIARTEEYSEGDAKLSDNVDASAAVKELADSFKAVAEKHGKHIEAQIDENVSLMGDKTRLSELFSILIDNAVKYCDDGGTVRIELKARKKGLQYVVSNDFAEGKNADYSRFFERFYRGDTSHNSEKAGYGIGLSMAESITKMHRGRISVSWSSGVISFTVLI